MTWTGTLLLFHDTQAGRMGGVEISPALGRELYRSRISSPAVVEPLVLTHRPGTEQYSATW